MDHATYGPTWLTDSRIATLMVKALLQAESELRFYSLDAWVVMPNHVHILFLPKTAIAKITRWLKGSTARAANQILGRTGQPFWQPESFDHWVRNESELGSITRYIERNPVAAGLPNWPYLSSRL